MNHIRYLHNVHALYYECELSSAMRGVFLSLREFDRVYCFTSHSRSFRLYEDVSLLKKLIPRRFFLNNERKFQNLSFLAKRKKKKRKKKSGIFFLCKDNKRTSRIDFDKFVIVSRFLSGGFAHFQQRFPMQCTLGEEAPLPLSTPDPTPQEKSQRHALFRTNSTLVCYMHVIFLVL